MTVKTCREHEGIMYCFARKDFGYRYHKILNTLQKAPFLTKKKQNKTQPLSIKWHVKEDGSPSQVQPLMNCKHSVSMHETII